MLKKEPPLSLYIHLPWCIKKCPYCDFNSHEFKTAVLAEKNYTDALIRDLEFELPKISNRKIASIFLGGGTPSLFSAEALEKILSTVRSEIQTTSEIEITLEANPGTAEAERFSGYREIGINRLSIGVQSFDDEKLNRLGRIHSADEALRAIELAENSGFSNINIDLMFGLPAQTLDEALTDIQTACDQAPNHISWYQLTIEPNTMFYKQTPKLPAHEIAWEMQTEGQKLLADKGYGQYEISAYALADKHCRHNMNYWQFGDYIGIGAGAHGKISNLDKNEIVRFKRHRIPDTYMQKAGSTAAIADEKCLQEEDIILEFMMNVFRLSDGFHSSLFPERTGLSLDKTQSLLNIASAQGFIRQESNEIRPTGKGKNYLNELLQIFVPDSERVES